MPAPNLSLVENTPAELTTDERDELLSLEATVAKGLQTFVAVGSALLAIRDRRLYREDHASFEAYCRDRWDISRPRAYQLMQAAAVVENLSTSGRHAGDDADPEHQEPDDEQPILPSTERQARALVGLPAEAQRAAWTVVQESPFSTRPPVDKVARAARDVLAEHPDVAPEDLPEAIRQEMHRTQVERARSRRIDPNRIVETMANQAALLCDDTDLIDFPALDDTRTDPWIATFEQTQQNLTDFIERLKERNTSQAPSPEPAPVHRSRGVGVRRGNEAVDCLKRIPRNDGLRSRGFQIVTDWIRAQT